MITFTAASQVILYDSIFFETGKPRISSASAKILLKITEKAKTMKYYEITLSAYLEKQANQKPQQSLALKRFQEICNFLIKQSMGTHIRDIEMVTVNSKEKNTVQFYRVKNRIDVTIREQFPDPAKEESDAEEELTLAPEPDTVITTKNGTRITIQGGSFYPLKNSDYVFEIKELLTTDDFINSNVSTTTSDRLLIKNARAIRILAIPGNRSLPMPVQIQKPVIILIPATDSAITCKLAIFYQAKDGKPFISWKKSRDSTTVRKLSGMTSHMITTTHLGWAMVGVLMTSCQSCMLSTPQFQQQNSTGKILLLPDQIKGNNGIYKFRKCDYARL